MLSEAGNRTVTNSATLTAATNMSFSMSANTIYRVRGVIFWDTTASGDYKWDFTYPGSPTLARMERMQCIAGGTPAEVVVDVAMPAAVSHTGTGTTGGFLKFDLVFHNASNAATFAYRFAQNSATVGESATLRAGSYMEYSSV